MFGRFTAGWSYGFIGSKIGREYVIKFVVAIALTPAIYALHEAIVHGLGVPPEPHEPFPGGPLRPNAVASAEALNGAPIHGVGSIEGGE